MTIMTGKTLAELTVPVPLTALLDGGVRKTFADLDHYATGGSRPD